MILSFISTLGVYFIIYASILNVCFADDNHIVMRGHENGAIQNTMNNHMKNIVKTATGLVEKYKLEHNSKTNIETSSETVQPMTRRTTVTTPGYLVTKVYENDTSCVADSASDNYTPELLVEAGIPIGLCMPFEVSGLTGSIEIGYDTDTVSNTYSLTVYYYPLTISCNPSFQQSQQVPDVVLPSSCMNYNNYTIEYYNYSVPVSTWSLVTTFTANTAPWTPLPVGDYTFIYSTGSGCDAGSTSTTTTASSGAIYTWFVANKCIYGAIAQCVLDTSSPYFNSAPQGSLVVETYASTTCASQYNDSYIFNEVVCQQLPAGSLEEVFGMIDMYLPTLNINDDFLIKASDIFVSSSYCGVYNQLTQPTMSPTEAPTTVAASKSSSTNEAEVVGVAVGSVSFVILAGVLIGVFCFRSTMMKICPSFLFPKEKDSMTTTDTATGIVPNQQGYVNMDDDYTVKKTTVHGTSKAKIIQPFANASTIGDNNL